MRQTVDSARSSFFTCFHVPTLECPAEFRKKNRQYLPEFFDFAAITLRNSIKFSGIPLNTEFRNIIIMPELFSDGIMATLFYTLTSLETN